MGRKNIFEQLNNKINTIKEIDRLETLIKIPIKYHLHYGNGFSRDYDIFEAFIDKYILPQWKSRGTSINCADIRAQLTIDESHLQKYSPAEPIEHVIALNYFEYLSNMLYIYSKSHMYQYSYGYRTIEVVDDTSIKTAKANLENILEMLNYKTIEILDEEKVLIIEKDAATTAVAEILSPELSYQVLQYNHHILAGDLDTKKSILHSLGLQLEPKRDQLSKLNFSLTDNLFFMFNNVFIRHNNVSEESKHYNQIVAKMENAELENWYDELYQLMLLAFLELDNIERTRQIDILRKKLKS